MDEFVVWLWHDMMILGDVMIDVIRCHDTMVWWSDDFG